MPFPEVQSARDYNRGLPAPIRSVHIAWAVALAVSKPLRAWATVPSRRPWAVPILWFVPLAFIVMSFDGAISTFFRSHHIGGDIRRELEAAQQYGQMVSSLLIALVIYLQDPPRRRRLLDWAAAFIVAGIVCNAMKLLIGRPRPMFNDPLCFLGPLGEYPINAKVGVRHAWEFWAGISSDLWSMPSSHTAYACLMAAAIASLYPRLRIIAGALATLVGFARVATGAHYPSDVFVGAAIGLSLGRTAMAHHWGERLARITSRAASTSDATASERHDIEKRGTGSPSPID